MHQVATAIAAREIKPRPIELAFDKTSKAWVSGDPYASTLLNALSLTFPDGESFFVAAIRATREGIDDPVLREQIKGFLAQEALHRREHERFNRHLKAQGIDTDRYYAEVAALLGTAERELNPMRRLAITCALEHFTALLAEVLLENPEIFASADPEARALWQWHAIEELDHKAVAFDVFKARGGSYWMRTLTMVAVTVMFFTKVSHIHVRLLAQERALKLSVLLSGFWRTWGPSGYFSRLLVGYLRYFKPSFHPDDRDTTALIRRYELVLAGRTSAA